MTDFHIGQHLTHPDYGNCIVIFVGNDYVGIEFEGGADALVKKIAFHETPAVAGLAIQPDIRSSSWPESTFIQESDDAQHYLGSHWDAFFEDSATPSGWLVFWIRACMAESSTGIDDGCQNRRTKCSRKFLPFCN
jgi:hypothetical protein